VDVGEERGYVSRVFGQFEVDLERSAPSVNVRPDLHGWKQGWPLSSEVKQVPTCEALRESKSILRLKLPSTQAHLPTTPKPVHDPISFDERLRKVEMK
jgi:hypothetical protein